jgi:release factor glutamine methyltransferase
MTIKEALKEASLILKNQKEASILLRYLTGYDQTQIILKENETLQNYDKYQKIIQRRKNHEPVEYITNTVSFYSKDFFIDHGALIPRPETEILIDKFLEIAKNFDTIRVAEIGTGSGIISIMLALLIDDINIVATDISDLALKIAKINAKKFEVEDKITFIKTSYLDGVSDNFDIIVSNPPYIADDFQLEQNLSYEPDNALFGGKVGDEMLKEIIDIWLDRQIPYLLCEMGYDQKKPLSSYLEEKGIFHYCFYRDLAGMDRGFWGKSGQLPHS